MLDSEFKPETEKERIVRLEKEIEDNKNEIKNLALQAQESKDDIKDIKNDVKNLKDTFQYVCKNIAKKSEKPKLVIWITRLAFYFMCLTIGFSLAAVYLLISEKTPRNVAKGNVLKYGQYLGEYLESNNGKYILKMQEDGNLVIYDLKPIKFNVERHWINLENGSTFNASPIWSSSGSSPLPITKFSGNAVEPTFGLVIHRTTESEAPNDSQYKLWYWISIIAVHEEEIDHIWTTFDVNKYFFVSSDTLNIRGELTMEDNGELILRHGKNIYWRSQTVDQIEKNNKAKESMDDNLSVSSSKTASLKANLGKFLRFFA